MTSITFFVAKVIEAGRYTPTGGNRQDVSYVVLREKIGECEKIALDVVRKMQPALAKVIPYMKNLVITVNSHNAQTRYIIMN